MQEIIQIRFNPKRLYARSLFSLIFTIVSIAAWQAREQGNLPTGNPIIDSSLILASYIGPPFFFMLFIFSVVPIFSKKSALVIDKKGIIDNSSLFITIGRLYWHEISGINLYKNSRGKEELHLYLRNSDKTLSGYNMIKRSILIGFHGLNKGIGSIMVADLNISSKKLLSVMHQFYKESTITQ